MAKDKKSFLLYTDLIHTLEKMPNEKAGELFKHILMYVNDMNPETDDLIIQLTFEPIKQQLKRDLQRYESTCEKNRTNGAKGGRPKNPTKPIESGGFPEEPKKPDNGTDNGTDNGNGIKEGLPEDKPFNFKNSLLEYGFEPLLVDRWLEVRKKQKGVNTDVAFDGFIREVEKSGIDKNEVMRTCIEKSWRGFDSSWLSNTKPQEKPVIKGMEKIDGNPRYVQND
jgi:hypothetical protein